MKALRKLSIVVPTVILVASLVGVWLTQGAMANLPYLRTKSGWMSKPRANNDLVDQKPWQTIESLTPLAVSVEEKRLVREAQRLADHEVDQAFAQALRQATLDTRTLTGDALALQQKIAVLQGLVKEDQTRVDAVTASLKAPATPAPAAKKGSVAAPAVSSDDLDVAKAQLQLDNDQLTDANTDLAERIGDKRGDIQQELTVREAAMKKFDAQNDSADTPSAVQSAKRYMTLFGRVSAWFDQRTRMGSIGEAQGQADGDVKELTAQHDVIEKQLSDGTAAAQKLTGQDRASALRRLHTLSQIHGILEDRIQTQRQLSAVYGRWQAQVERQHQIVLHLILQSLAFVGFILLCAAILTAVAEHLLNRIKTDRRSLHTLRTITMLAIQAVTLLLVLLAVFGVPSQMPTILGLATAGATVVFQDFILSFFGWFVLMSKSGIRVGDWVEINGVGGEVISLTIFRTTLLETGNWTDKGHPTGRTVAFLNSFAFSGQYFNFSTSGQWLWDEIQVNIPGGPHTYEIVDSIHETVQREIADDVKQAEVEWNRALGNAHGLTNFSVKPTVDLRPASSGVDVIVRYMTRASDRLATRNRIYQTVIDLMRESEKQTALESETK